MTNAEQIANIAAYQACPTVHQLTCGNDSGHRPLVGYETSPGGGVWLQCLDCDYTQSHVPKLPNMETYNRRGLWIVLEGIDGSGKSTQIPRLRKRLAGVGQHLVVSTMEPSDGVVGAFLRSTVLPERRVDERATTFLFAADRVAHFKARIEPALGDGAIVLCDRYALSTLAYQGLDNPELFAEALAVNRQFPVPDITIFVEIGAEEAATRLIDQGAPRDRYEHQVALEAISAKYEHILALAAVWKDWDHNIVHVDGRGTEEEVTERMWAIVSGVVTHALVAGKIAR